MKITLKELREVIRQTLSEHYDDWKLASPPEYDTMGDQPCTEPCPPDQPCPYCNGMDPNMGPPDDEDMLGMNRRGGRGER